MTREKAMAALEHFCSFPLSTSQGVLAEFAKLPRAIARFDGDKHNFVYVPGTREDRVLLIAHADTVWDTFYDKGYFEQTLKKTVTDEGVVYVGTDPSCGIGADDRAGCAMLWLLRESGHSLLITDGEERGQIGAHYIREHAPELFDELNRHRYMIQLDRRGKSDYKVYHLPVSREFLSFVERATGYQDAGRLARTDIVALCRDVCGVNLSIGYYDEHKPEERLVFEDWYHTLTLVEGMLAGEQCHYPLAPADREGEA
ncbi:MAG: hypothetical protein IJV98_05820 [Clostridia bacterium]|nr:hypothetical protein [Clostridia bacterium]